MSDEVGIAIRLDSGCGLLQECGTGGSGYVSCCPDSTECAKDTDGNVYCCDPDDDEDDCMEELYDEPRCADTEWGLYNNHFWDNAAGYFCCASESRGYNQTSEFSNGCAESNVELEDDEEWLPLVDQMIPSGTGFVTTTGTPPTETAESEGSATGAGTNVGAIAGGIVGGVAGVALIGAAAWLLLRRRKPRGAALPLDEDAKGPPDMDAAAVAPAPSPGPPREMDASPPEPRELDALAAKKVEPRELDADPRNHQSPSELPA